MSVRLQVTSVSAFAPLPPEDECTEELIFALEGAVSELPRPVTDDEALALLDIFDTPDDSSYFGLLWSVVHTVETAPRWPPDEIWERPGPWFDILRLRLANAREVAQDNAR